MIPAGGMYRIGHACVVMDVHSVHRFYKIIMLHCGLTNRLSKSVVLPLRCLSTIVSLIRLILPCWDAVVEPL